MGSNALALIITSLLYYVWLIFSDFVYNVIIYVVASYAWWSWSSCISSIAPIDATRSSCSSKTLYKLAIHFWSWVLSINLQIFIFWCDLLVYIFFSLDKREVDGRKQTKVSKGQKGWFLWKCSYLIMIYTVNYLPDCKHGVTFWMN